MINYSDASMDITKKLLISLGLEIQNETNVIYDQETKSPIFFEGAAVKANIDPNKSLYIDTNDIRLEPLNPKCTKLLERLFGKFLDDSEEMGNITHCITYFFDRLDTEDKEEVKYRLNIKFEKVNPYDRDLWVGNWYYNKIICYNEAIFALDGTFDDVDLREYDIKQDIWEE